MSVAFRTRYPGAQPFGDDELSQRSFFGRTSASVALTNQVLANRLVVVFGKSGLGKTSLLRAGLAPRLRAEGYLPLNIRLNDPGRGLLPTFRAAIEFECGRQGIEYAPGSADSLWDFFRSVEFWRDDLLLVPVLILDQFEEVFTLHADAERGAFLSELAQLIRGTPPAGMTGPGVDKPPQLRVVLSLREDYLGLLEDASDQIPQILESRFRTAPLGVEAAEAALVEPARLDDPAFGTPPFRYEAETVRSILEFLSLRRAADGARGARYVDPFQLQLVCQRVERTVAARRREQVGAPVTLKELGGAQGLEDMLKRFYLDILLTVRHRKDRRAVQLLCHDHLISPEGRRLSLDEGLIVDKLDISPPLLRELVSLRLLRTENRAESTYYELSHDALIDPVLAARGWSVIWRDRGQLLGHGLSLLFVAVLIVALPFVLLADLKKNLSRSAMQSEVLGALLCGVAFYFVGTRNLKSLREALRSLRRYRGRALSGESLYSNRPKKKIAFSPIVGLVACVALIAFDVLVALVACWVLIKGLTVAESSAWVRYQQSHRLLDVPPDFVVYLVGAVVSAPFWALVIVTRLDALLGQTLFGTVGARHPPWSSKAWLKAMPWLLGAVAASVGVALIFALYAVLLDCRVVFDGVFPDVLPASRFAFLPRDCKEMAKDGLAFLSETCIAVAHVGVLGWGLFSCLAHALTLLRGDTRSTSPQGSQRPSGAFGQRGIRRSAIFGGVLVSILVPLSGAYYLARLQPQRPAPVTVASETQAGKAAASVTPRSIVGRVVNARGHGVEDATVRLLAAEAPHHVYQIAHSEKDGRFSLDPVGPWPLELVAERADEGFVTSEPFRAADVPGDILLQLKPSDALRGRVVDSRGSGVPDVDLVVRAASWPIAVRSAGDGTFRLSNLPEAAHSILAIAPGYKRALFPLPTGTNAKASPFTVRLESGKRVSGRVRDDRGVGVRARVVVCEGDFGEQPYDSSEDGSFELPPETIGCDVRAEHAGLAASEVERVEEGGPLELHLRPAGGVTGNVRDSEGRTVPKFWLGVEVALPEHGAPFERPPPWEFDDSTGSFGFYDVAPGRYVFLVWTAGQVRGRSEIIEVRSGQLTRGVQLVTQKLATLTGTVRDDSKQALAGVAVKFDQLSDAFSGDTSTQTDSDGNYRLESAFPGRLSLRFEKNGFSSKLVGGIETATASARRLDVVLAAGAGLDFSGTGTSIARDGHGLFLDSVGTERPAGQAGLRVGDRLLRVDGASTEGMSVSDALQRARGAAGSEVAFTVFRPETYETLTRIVLRKELHND